MLLFLEEEGFSFDIFGELFSTHDLPVATVLLEEEEVKKEERVLSTAPTPISHHTNFLTGPPSVFVGRLASLVSS